MSQQSAAGQMDFATEVARRLPQTFAALAAGQIHPIHLRIIEEATRFLTDADAAKADAFLAGAAPGMTFGELRYAARKLVLKLDPDTDRKRKEAARREAHVRRFQEESGNAGMVARELPSDEVLASWQHVEQRALDLRAAGDPRHPAGPPRPCLPRSAARTRQPRRPRRFRPRQRPGPAAARHRPTRPARNRTRRSRRKQRPRRPRRPRRPVFWPRPRRRAEPGRPGHHHHPPDYLPRPLRHPRRSRRVRHPRRRRRPRPGRRRRPPPQNPLVRHRAEPRRHRRRPRLPPRPPPPARHRTPRPPPTPRRRARHRASGHPVHPADPVARGPCDHVHAETGYRPSRKLQHLVRARSARCTAPGCGRPAARCDLDHTVPWDQGGITCECDLAPLCRHHHKCKQAQGWRLAQPEPGVLLWRTPAGRVYTTKPTEYIT